MQPQIRADGSHFEQSAYYHVYALDCLLFHHVLGGTVPLTAISRMADYLAALMGPARRLPFLGDDDGGRFFHPYGARDTFGRATLATCARLLDRLDLAYDGEDIHEQASWCLPGSRGVEAGTGTPHTSRLFPAAGISVTVPPR